MEHKAGFVNILGKPNAGKSTLLNALIGEKLAIVTSKAQTTRHRILGFINEEDYQIIFSDTPGIIEPHYKLQEKMMNFVEESLKDGDIFLFVIDAADPECLISESELYTKVERKLLHAKVPVIIAVNKMDLIDEEHLGKLGAILKERFPDATLIPISAEHKFNLDVLLKTIKENMPESPPYFDKEDISDKHLRFFVAEIIREKILKNYQQEIPYSVEIAIQSFKESPEITKIEAEILVNRDSQKSIIIGKGGSAIKKLGVDSRKEIEAFLGVKIFLGLFVKVKKDWRDDDKALSNFGYGS